MNSNCLICKKEFKTWPSRIKIGEGKYCSKSCANNAKTGKPNLKKRYNIFNSCESCKNDFRVAKWNKDQRFCCRKCVSVWQAISRRGENNHQWRGGLSRIGQRLRNTVDYAKWRIAVLRRDNFTCVKCGYKSKTTINKKSDVQVDHIKQFAYYPTLRLNIGNGRTLCISCHKSTETFNRKEKHANIH